MSQEEFDNRLRSSFSEEFVPPKEHLWANITEKLEKKSRKPLWYWLVPVLVAISVSLAWLGSGLLHTNESNQSASENSRQTAPADQNLDPTTIHNNTKANEDKSENQASTIIQSNEKEIEVKINLENSGIKQAQTGIQDQPKALVNSASTHVQRTNPKSQFEIDLINDMRQGASSGLGNGNLIKNPALRNHILPFEESLRFFQLADFPFYPIEINTDPEAGIALLAKEEKEQVTHPKPTKSNNVANLESKKWLSFGIGPLIAQNSLKINDDSQAYIHQHLWNNKEMVTNNGIGINGFLSYHYKFGRKNRFSIESGLNYSFRTENIQFNESTYDIAVRSANSNEITKYIRLRVWISPQPGDTTFYNAAQGFTMFKKNKYNVITVPLRFNSEHKISDNTFISLGLGAGFSMISAKNISHYNLIQEKEETKSSMRQLSASFNTMLNLYTKFNDMGQIGIYTGFQSYLRPWEVNSGQYKIQMSDIQFGLSFRRPLN